MQAFRRLLTLLSAALVASALAATAQAARVSPSDPHVSSGDRTATRTAAKRFAANGPTDVKNLDTGLSFATIQDAINDAGTLDGHVLDVQVTPHSEGLVTVNKAVTIQGGGGGGATILSTTDTGTSGDARAWFLVTVANVTFRNLTFDGSANVIWQCLRFKEGGARAEDCTFQNIQSLPAHYNGVGVVGFKNTTVEDCVFSDIGRIGVIYFGTTVTAGVVNRCQYTGKGAGDWLDYGIELGGGAVASLTNNTITGCTGVASVDGSTSAGMLITTYFGAGTSGTLTGNVLTGNSEAVAVGYDAADASTVAASSNDLSGNASDAVGNTSSTTTVDASGNWWGTNTPAGVAAEVAGTVDYTPWLDTGTDISGSPGFQGSRSTLHVDDDSPQSGALNRIQEGLNLVTASTVIVAPGTYPGGITLSAAVNLLGAQAGVGACGRVVGPPNPAVESVISGPAPGPTLLTLLTGCAGSVVDGFSFTGGTRGLESTSGPLHGVQIRNNHFAGFTGSGVFLNDPGTDMTVSGNNLDGAAKTGAGGTFHLDTDLFDGFHFLNNCIVHSTAGATAQGTGFFVDGNRNVRPSIARAPLWNANLVDHHVTGVNLGTRAFVGGTISGNQISNNGDGVFPWPTTRSDGMQGGFQQALITGNQFTGNGKWGLALTSFGSTDTTRGARNCLITLNSFTGNDSAGLFFSASQAAGLISTNVANNNNLAGNGVGAGRYGALYRGAETINVRCNWWGHLNGPDVPPGNPNPPGDALYGANMQFSPWLNAAAPGGSCNQYGPNHVTANTSGLCISNPTPCVTVPVVFNRADASNARGISVTFVLSSNLELCSAPSSSIVQGTWLSGFGSSFQIVDNGGGSYTVDQAILGLPCGVTSGGQLFTVQVKKTAPAGDGAGTITVTAVTVRDCANAPLAGIPGPPATIPIDFTAPAAITGLAATQVKTGNPTGSTTGIQITWPPVELGATVQVWRAPYGNYPEYDDAPNAGSVPATPGFYPPGAPWVLTGVTTSGGIDSPTKTQVIPGSTNVRVNGGYIGPPTGWNDPVYTNFFYKFAGTANGRNNHDLPPGPPTGDPTGLMDPNLALTRYFKMGAGSTVTIAGTFSPALTPANFSVEGESGGATGQWLTIGLINQPWIVNRTGLGYNSFMHNAVAGNAMGRAVMVLFKTIAGTDVMVGMDDWNGDNGSNGSHQTAASISSFLYQLQEGLDKNGSPVAQGGRMRYSLNGGLYGGWVNYTHDFVTMNTSLMIMGWTQGTTTSQPMDLTLGDVTADVSGPARDFWYYVAYVADPCGNRSGVSNKTNGTLDYHLGDVTDGTGAGQNNLVNTVDISMLGAYYGTTLGTSDPRAVLDVGPTTDYSVDARPTTDNKVGFEDLMMFAINYGQVSAPQFAIVPAADQDAVWVDAPSSVSTGGTASARVWMKGAGDIQGLSAQLSWNRGVVEPVSVEAGELVTAQNGVVLSAAPGGVDMAMLGPGRGLSGEGVLATVTFRALASGDPGIGIASLAARDSRNQPLELGGTGVGGTAGLATALAPAQPNPFQRATTLAFSLARKGDVTLAIYSVDGRRVKTLASGPREAGAYRVVWNGTDDRGAAVRPGVFFARLTTAEGRFHRTVALLK